MRTDNAILNRLIAAIEYAYTHGMVESAQCALDDIDTRYYPLSIIPQQ